MRTGFSSLKVLEGMYCSFFILNIEAKDKAMFLFHLFMFGNTNCVYLFFLSEISIYILKGKEKKNYYI